MLEMTCVCLVCICGGNTYPIRRTVHNLLRMNFSHYFGTECIQCLHTFSRQDATSFSSQDWVSPSVHNHHTKWEKYGYTGSHDKKMESVSAHEGWGSVMALWQPAQVTVFFQRLSCWTPWENPWLQQRDRQWDSTVSLHNKAPRCLRFQGSSRGAPRQTSAGNRAVNDIKILLWEYISHFHIPLFGNFLLRTWHVSVHCARESEITDEKSTTVHLLPYFC